MTDKERNNVCNLVPFFETAVNRNSFWGKKKTSKCCSFRLAVMTVGAGKVSVIPPPPSPSLTIVHLKQRYRKRRRHF